MSTYSTTGVDYAWAKPDPALLKRSGYKFALRYLSHDPSKNLTESELKALWANGLDTGVVWESAANRALTGTQGGKEDAHSAKTQADALGLKDIPVFFAVDFDVTPAQKPTMGKYFQGAVSVLGKSRVRCYGGYYAIKYLVEKGIVPTEGNWQTLAWSGGQWHPAAGIQQYKNGVKTAGGEVDLNRADESGLACLRGPAAKPSQREQDERKLRKWERELTGIRREANLRRDYGSKHPWTLAMRIRARKLERLIARQKHRLQKRAAKAEAKQVKAVLRQASNKGDDLHPKITVPQIVATLTAGVPIVANLLAAFNVYAVTPTEQQALTNAVNWAVPFAGLLIGGDAAVRVARNHAAAKGIER